MQPIELTLAPNPQHRGQDQVVSTSCAAMVFRSAHETVGALLARIIATESLREGTLYPVPTSRDDITCAGIVWINKDDEARVDCLPDAIPLYKPASDLEIWLPRLSQIAPALPSGMLRDAAAKDQLIRVWLPHLGLVGFAKDDAICARDWVTTADRGSARPWSMPPETWSPPQHLSELSMLQPPSLESFLSGLQSELGPSDERLIDVDSDGIAETPNPAGKMRGWVLRKLDQLAEFGRSKKKPDEESQSSGKLSEKNKNPASGAAGAAAAAGLAGAAGAAGAAAAMGKMLGKISAPMAAAMSRMMQGEREDQIEKLLKMMSKNPDEALKYAIPLNSLAETFRGFSMPGAALTSRLTDFSMGSLFGGGSAPADFWSINHDLQMKLQQKYREQANREIAAGRYRRAAYIFAHLLADLRAAASVLERGKFYAEAAVLYRDKLHDKPSAARCFASCGMYVEACELFLSMNQYERAGEIWVSAEEPDRAREMFEQAFRNYKSQGAIVSAAKVLDARLQRRDEAIELLCDQWPTGPDAQQGALLAFQWMGEDGRHEQADRTIRQMHESSVPHYRANFAALAADTAKRYPDRTVREISEDLCRLSAASSLKSGAPIERNSVLESLGELTPSDPQLKRDAIRFADQQRERERAQQLPRKKPKRGAPHHLGDWDLPPDYRYLGCRAVEHWNSQQLVVIAARNQSLVLRRITNTKRYSVGEVTTPIALRRDADSISASDIMFGKVGDSPHDRSILRVEVYAPIIENGVSQAASFPIARLQAKRSDQIVAVACGPDDEPWELSFDSQSLELRHQHHRTYDLTEHLVEAVTANPFEQVLEDDDLSSGGMRFTLAVAAGWPVIGINRHLFELRRGEIVALDVITGEINYLAPSPRHSRNRVAIAHDRGLDVMYLDVNESVSVCSHRSYERVIWAGQGRIVAISGTTLHSFEYDQTRFRPTGRAHLKRPDGETSPIELLALNTDIVAVVWTNGSIARYLLP